MSEPWTDAELEAWEQRLQDSLTRENVEAFFSGLPDETHSEYYPQIRILFNLTATEQRNEIMTAIFDDDDLLLERDASVSDVRFAALYFLANAARRKNNIEEFSTWVDRGRPEYQHKLQFQYLESILHRERDEYPHAIHKCRPVFNEHPDNWPIAVGFAHNIVHGVEAGLVDESQTKELAQEAIDTIETVIRTKPAYGKSYLIKARALAALDRFEEALDAVDRAIELEDSKKEDYAERIADRYFHRVRIEVLQQKHDLEEKTRAVDNEVSNVQSRFVQLLGFFAAILAVVFTSTQIAVSLQATEAIALVIVLTGGLLSSFASLSLLLPGTLDLRRVIVVIGLGFAMMAGGSALAFGLA